MSCGVPVVAARVGAFEDLVLPGETGFLVPVGDVAAITEATGRLMADDGLRARMAKAAREKVITQHKLVHEAEAITAVYRTLLGQDQGQPTA